MQRRSSRTCRTFQATRPNAQRLRERYEYKAKQVLRSLLRQFLLALLTYNQRRLPYLALFEAPPLGRRPARARWM
ncbi:Uncharacterised protein [Chlamydia trachomatis]|nr:Uncharacterised protein [Chlamydia trachomatis]